MDCREAGTLLSAYVDSELDARSSLEMENHLQSCSRCRQALEAVRSVRQAVAQSAPHYRAPNALRKDIRSALKPQIHAPRPNFVRVAAFCACVIFALFVGWSIGRSQKPANLEVELLNSHVRALMSDHLADVISTDKHTVKPWFNGKIDYSPPVTDLAAQDFPLTGGRLEYVDGQRVAVLVYKKQKHIIDLYVRPSSRSYGDSIAVNNGFNVLHWGGKGFEYWAVSDLNAAELREFCDLLMNTAT